jgi:hypothetical protein
LHTNLLKVPKKERKKEKRKKGSEKERKKERKGERKKIRKRNKEKKNTRKKRKDTNPYLSLNGRKIRHITLLVQKWTVTYVWYIVKDKQPAACFCNLNTSL